MKSIFIVLDGIDGCGKTTHVNLLKEWFIEQDLKVTITSEPTETEIGRIIRSYLNKGENYPEMEALLFAADRVNHSNEIKGLLKKGINVISDRYLESSIAYQGAEGVNLDWIQEINKFVHDPDFCMILDIDPEVAMARIKKERQFFEKFEKIEFLKKVRSIFLIRAKEMGYKIVDTSGPIQEVHEKIKNMIRPFLL